MGETEAVDREELEELVQVAVAEALRDSRELRDLREDLLRVKRIVLTLGRELRGG